MADYVITPGSVLAGASSTVLRGNAGAAITAGQALYQGSGAGTIFLPADSTTVTLAQVRGIALNDAALGQPVTAISGGSLTLNAILTVGDIVALSSTATSGALAPVADISSGDVVTIIGVAESTTSLKLSINPSGVTV